MVGLSCIKHTLFKIGNSPPYVDMITILQSLPTKITRGPSVTAYLQDDLITKEDELCYRIQPLFFKAQ